MNEIIAAIQIVAFFALCLEAAYHIWKGQPFQAVAFWTGACFVVGAFS